MRRKRFTLVAAASGVLLLATLVLWVRSYRVGDFIDPPLGSRFAFESHDGSIACWCAYRPGVRVRQAGGTGWAHSTQSAPEQLTWDTLEGVPRPGVHFLGFCLFDIGSQFMWVLIVPYWMLAAVCTLLPTWLLWSRHFVARRRMSKGLCPACGYDLRATPERCPECGAVAAATSSPS